MRQRISGILLGLLFLTGFGILIYPTVADQWNTYRQSRLISSYEKTVEEMEPEDFSREWEAAESFNASIIRNNLYGDVFGAGEEESRLKDTPYWQVLNVNGDGVMGYLSIPEIHVKISIYHGTSEEVLQTGAGHLDGTGIPIGGEGTHSVLAAHRGLPSARLFTDIDQLEKGDLFYLHILDQVLAYQVDQITDMVEKDDRQTLEAAMQTEEGEDYVTLFTCTPYGVNSHRLLVRGHRTEYSGEDEISDAPVDTMLEAVQNYYMLYLVLGLSVTLLVILILKVLIKPGKNQEGDRNK